jgi:hypothetical protein
MGNQCGAFLGLPPANKRSRSRLHKGFGMNIFGDGDALKDGLGKQRQVQDSDHGRKFKKSSSIKLYQKCPVDVRRV